MTDFESVMEQCKELYRKYDTRVSIEINNERQQDRKKNCDVWHWEIYIEPDGKKFSMWEESKVEFWKVGSLGIVAQEMQDSLDSLEMFLVEEREMQEKKYKEEWDDRKQERPDWDISDSEYR